MEPKHYDILSQKELGRYLRYYRQRAGFTARYVAERLGYASQQSVFNIESGKSRISAEKMYDYLELCGVGYDEAFTEPYAVIDNPTRRKRHGSQLLRELNDTFRCLNKSNQALVVKIARALKSQEEIDSSSDSSDE